MKKKVIGLLVVGIVIISIVVLIAATSSKKENREKKEINMNKNMYTCIKKDEDTDVVTKYIKHTIKLKNNKNKSKEDTSSDKKIVDTYITINNYKYSIKKEYEKKCYELKMNEEYINSSKDIDFKEKVTCNNKKKFVSVKDEFIIDKLSESGKKSLDRVLKYQKDDNFDIKAWLDFEKHDKYDCE